MSFGRLASSSGWLEQIEQQNKENDNEVYVCGGVYLFNSSTTGTMWPKVNLLEE